MHSNKFSISNAIFMYVAIKIFFEVSKWHGHCLENGCVCCLLIYKSYVFYAIY